MLLIKEMRAIALSVSLETFCQQLGPFALIKRPPGADQTAAFQALGLPVNIATTELAHREEVEKGSLALLFAFDELAVSILPPLGNQDELLVGRQPDCDLVIDDPSVSKRHAVLKWDFMKLCCTVADLGSTNGTLLNGGVPVHNEHALRNGDIVSFGQAHFWYLLTETLYGRLSRPKGSNLLGSHSG